MGQYDGDGRERKGVDVGDSREEEDRGGEGRGKVIGAGGRT